LAKMSKRWRTTEKAYKSNKQKIDDARD